MMTPGLAPALPASHDPSVLTLPFFLYSLVFSPKYQTLPFLSWAYQSKVFSLSLPCAHTLSSTTTHFTPIICLVEWVTVITSRSVAFLVFLRETKVVPGLRGKYLLSIVVVKSEEFM